MMNNYIRFCIFLNLLLLIIFAEPDRYLIAQTGNLQFSDSQYVARHWDNTRGLPVNTVSRIVKDETGYIWGATEEGLVRFDGVNFKTFSTDNVQDLTSASFYDVSISSQGGIWAANANSIVHANENKIRIYDAQADTERTWINTLAEDHDGNVWAGTYSGDLLILSEGRIVISSRWRELNSGPVLIIKKISDGMLVGAQNGLFKYNRETDSIEIYPELENIEVRAVAESADGNLWIGTRTHGLYHQRDDQMIVIDESFGLAHNQVNTINLPGDGRVWVGLGMEGVQLITKGEVISLKENEFGFSEVNDIFVTGEGNVWLTAAGRGIIQMIPADIRMLREANGLSDDITLPVYQDKNGVVWSGTAGSGINRIENNQITQITPDYGLPHGVILAIYGVDDYIYIGSAFGLNRFNPETFTIDRHFSEEDGLASSIVHVVYQDSAGRVWMGTRSGGIHRLHNHQNLERLEVSEQFENAEFISIFEDSSGSIWFGTSSSGLLKIDSDGTMTGYSIQHGSSIMVLSLYEDPEGSVWAGTTEGLFVLKNGEFKSFNRSNGLQFNGIFRIIEDDYGYVWASGNFGIQRMKTEDLHALKHDDTGEPVISVRLFDTSDGMANHEANGGVFPAGWKMNNGEIWFPTMQGIAIINPAELTSTEASVKAHIKSLSYGNTFYSASDENIIIPPGVHNLEMSYGSFDYKKPHAINYSYRISGSQRISRLSDEWQSVGNRNVTYFTLLNPGDYVFEVKAEQFGHVSEISSISFTVEPFFFQNSWFIALNIIGLFLAGYFVHQFYSKHRLGVKLKKQVDDQTKELQKRNVTLEKVLKDVENQNRVLKRVAWVQSHELRGPLSQILGMVDVAKNYDRFKNIKKDKEYLLEEISRQAEELDGIIRKLNADIEKIKNPDGQ